MQKLILLVKGLGLFARTPAGNKPAKDDMFSLRLQRMQQSRQAQAAKAMRHATFRSSQSHRAA